MNDFPAEFDLDQLKGINLQAITFGTWKVSFLFSEGWSIGVEDDLSIDDQERSFLPEVLPALYPLVNQTVKEVRRGDSGTIAIEFETGRVLYIYGLTKEFECYQIERNGKTLVVV